MKLFLLELLLLLDGNTVVGTAVELAAGVALLCFLPGLPGGSFTSFILLAAITFCGLRLEPFFATFLSRGFALFAIPSFHFQPLVTISRGFVPELGETLAPHHLLFGFLPGRILFPFAFQAFAAAVRLTISVVTSIFFTETVSAKHLLSPVRDRWLKEHFLSSA
ncbi:MAG: hypothetical protein WC459_01545 [Patescibacteria group bacterium]